MTVDDAIRNLGHATASQIRHAAQSNIEDTYARLVQLEAQRRVHIRVVHRPMHMPIVTWVWNEN